MRGHHEPASQALGPQQPGQTAGSRIQIHVQTDQIKRRHGDCHIAIVEYQDAGEKGIVQAT